MIQMWYFRCLFVDLKFVPQTKSSFFRLDKLMLKEMLVDNQSSSDQNM